MFVVRAVELNLSQALSPEYTSSARHWADGTSFTHLTIVQSETRTVVLFIERYGRL